MSENQTHPIIFYTASEGRENIEAFLDKETFWLSQKQMSTLFDVDLTVITRHLKNIFKSGELEEESNVQKMHFAHSAKPIKFYSLDAIISVGYEGIIERRVVMAMEDLARRINKFLDFNEYRILEGIRKNFSLTGGA